MEDVLVLNRVTCGVCNTTLTSMHRHDYQFCTCDNHTFIDGGTDYQRCGGKDMEAVNIDSVYLSDGFDKCRTVPIWGSYGKNGDEPLKWMSVSEMTDEHLEALLHYNVEEWRKDLMKQEIEHRKKQKHAG